MWVDSGCGYVSGYGRGRRLVGEPRENRLRVGVTSLTPPLIQLPTTTTTTTSSSCMGREECGGGGGVCELSKQIAGELASNKSVSDRRQGGIDIQVGV